MICRHGYKLFLHTLTLAYPRNLKNLNPKPPPHLPAQLRLRLNHNSILAKHLPPMLRKLPHTVKVAAAAAGRAAVAAALDEGRAGSTDFGLTEQLQGPQRSGVLQAQQQQHKEVAHWCLQMAAAVT
jgi:hypothetical protein